ncbi:MAG: hypothetical protein GXY44_07390 [Phycisphaerales bacterium]|nr:hypothetical protein [Phycisphaerales bacterium]
MAKPSQDDISTEGVSIGNMSPEEVDAFLSQIVAEKDRGASNAKQDVVAAGQSSTGTRNTPPDKTAQAKTEQKAPAVDVENTLDQVDAQLAELEAMLATATGDEEGDSCDSNAVVSEEKQAREDPVAESQEHQDESTEANIAIASEAADSESADDGSEFPENSLAEPAIVEDPDTVSEAMTETEQQPTPSLEAAGQEEQPTTIPAGAAEQVETADQAVVNSRYRLRALPADLAALTLKLVIQILIIIDLPFARLGRGLKNILGYAAIGTLFVAVGTWMAGTYLRTGS